MNAPSHPLLHHDRADAAAIILAASYDLRPETAEETLRQFAREMLPSIDSALARAAAGDSSAEGAK